VHRGKKGTFVQVAGACMAPRVPEGSWVRVDRGTAAGPGDLVVARRDGRLLVKQLAEWAGQRWLVALQGCAPVAVEPPIEIWGVVEAIVLSP
jgi:SOS-response transcriptional repressor LexA